MKQLISFLFAGLLIMPAAAQHRAILKHPLTAADSAYLKKLTKDEIDFGGALNVQYISADFLDEKSQPDKPFSEAEIAKQKKKLKHTYEDANVYFDIGMIYLGAHNYDSAGVYLQKALVQAKERVKANPDSASAYYKLGTVYYRLGQNADLTASWTKGLLLDPSDTAYRFGLPGFYLYAGNAKASDSLIRYNIAHYPANPKTYLSLPLCYFYGSYLDVRNGKPEQLKSRYEHKSATEAVDMHLMTEAYEKYRQNKQIALLYHISKLDVLLVKLMARTAYDTTHTEAGIFTLDEYDRKDMDELTAYFLSVLSDPDIKDKCVPNRCMGFIKMLEQNGRDAVPYFKEAIRLRPINKGTYDNNCAGDYDNLAAFTCWQRIPPRISVQ